MFKSLILVSLLLAAPGNCREKSNSVPVRAILIEPTETESKETMDAFIEAMIDIANLSEKDPEKIKASPLTTPFCRPDDTAAAKNLDLACL